MQLELALRLPLRDFSLDVQIESTAQVLGIFGRSGSGKTSLLETLAGLREGAEGCIQVNGCSWLEGSRSVPVHRRGVGYVPQGSVLFPDRNVLANLRAGNRGWFRRKSPLEQRAIEVFELEPLLHALPERLSGGEAQRVALARALCSEPRLLLLDEPTASLGAEFRQRALPFLERVRTEFGIPMVIVSHEPLDLQYLCDDLVVLSQGRVVDRGTPLDLLSREGSPDRAATSLLRGRVLEVEPHLTRVGLSEDPETELFLPGRVGAPGDNVAVSVAASQVLLSRRAPEDISALNVLEGTVTEIREFAHHLSVDLRLGNGPARLTAELTWASRDRIRLEVGSKAYAIVKALSARTIADSALDRAASSAMAGLSDSEGPGAPAGPTGAHQRPLPSLAPQDEAPSLVAPERAPNTRS